MAFAAGNVVKLKTGGPNMTIDRVSSDGKKIHCTWFQKDRSAAVSTDPEDGNWSGPWSHEFDSAALEMVNTV